MKNLKVKKNIISKMGLGKMELDTNMKICTMMERKRHKEGKKDQVTKNASIQKCIKP